MAVEFPPELPGVDLATINTHEQTAYRTNDSEIGPATYQLLSLNVPTIFQVTWFLDCFDFQTFENFFEYNLNKGVKSFDINLPVGSGVKLHECNFVNGYSNGQIQKSFTVTATLRAIAKQFDDAAKAIEVIALNSLFEGRLKVKKIARYNNYALVIVPDALEGLNYFSDRSDEVPTCDLLTSKPAGPHDYDQGFNAPASGNLSGPLEIALLCVSTTWRVNVQNSASSIKITIKNSSASGDDLGALFNFYIFGPDGTLRKQELNKLMPFNEVALDEIFTTDVTGEWIVAVTGTGPIDTDASFLGTLSLVA